MDWFQAGVTVGGFMVAQIARDAYNKGRSRTQVETLEKNFDEHRERLDGHDKEFATLPDRFITRNEIAPQLEDIRATQRRTNNLLDRILLRKAGVPDDDGG